MTMPCVILGPVPEAVCIAGAHSVRVVGAGARVISDAVRVRLQTLVTVGESTPTSSALINTVMGPGRGADGLVLFLYFAEVRALVRVQKGGIVVRLTRRSGRHRRRIRQYSIPTGIRTGACASTRVQPHRSPVDYTNIANTGVRKC